MSRTATPTALALAAALAPACWAALGVTAPTRADDAPPPMTRQADVIYGRKYGTALTLDVFRPGRGANGAGVVLIVSGGFFSSHEAVSPLLVSPLIGRGYTVFAVVHGSQPRYTVPEIVADLNRAVRFVRRHSAEYGVDPGRLGVTGASAGAHLSLMLGTHGGPGDPRAADPVDRESSRVQAVACFFPPTDFLNYGGPGRALTRALDFDPVFRPAFDFHERDPQTNLWAEVTDPGRYAGILRDISPINHVTPDDPPTLIHHGEADKIVPVQQSEAMVAKLREAGVAARLVVRPDAGHGWLTMGHDFLDFADWFDAHLKPPAAPPAAVGIK